MRIKAMAKYPWPKLTDRLNQHPVSRLEALRQLQEMMPLSASALRELGQNYRKSSIGPKEGS
jgi:hypothetical protein